MKRTAILFALVIATQMFAPTNSPAQRSALRQVQNKIPLKARPFPLQAVRLLDGPFREAMLRDQQYLLALDSDRLGYRTAP